jgi:hypothetical protein
LIGGAAALAVAAAVVVPSTSAMAGSGVLLPKASAVPLASVRPTIVPVPVRVGVQSVAPLKMLLQPTLTVTLPAGPGIGYVSSTPFEFDMHKTTYAAEEMTLKEIALTGKTLTITATDLTPNGRVTWGGDCSFANAQPAIRLNTRACTFTFDRDINVVVYF